MVVFGAGASYDSLDAKRPTEGNPGWLVDEEFRPPLANELFGLRGVFANAISQLERIQPIIPLLRRPTGSSVEAVLRKLQDEAEEYPDRHGQLMAVRYYLQFTLHQLETEWKGASRGVTNYKALLDQINRWRRHTEAVSLVTFNYDTLLEDAMSVVGPRISKLEDYAFGNPAYRLFKLHGSVNWGKVVETHSPYPTNSNWAIARDHIERASRLRIVDDFVIVTEFPCGLWGNRVGLVPAVAIPVERKSHFECPQKHLSELERLLPGIDKLLLIGWRAREEHFLSLLSKHLKAPLTIQVVAGSDGEARQIFEGLVEKALSHLTVTPIFEPGGFTDFVVHQKIDRILSHGG